MLISTHAALLLPRLKIKPHFSCKDAQWLASEKLAWKACRYQTNFKTGLQLLLMFIQFTFLSALPDVYAPRVKSSLAPLDWCEGVKRCRSLLAAAWQLPFELLYSSTTRSRAPNCTGTSCTPRGERKQSCCRDQNWACTHQLPSPDLEKPHFPASVSSSPMSQEQEWWL